MLFIKISLGCLNNPYVTYRELSMKTEANRSAMFVWLLMVVYFIFASLIRNGWENPYLLTWQLNKLIMAAIIGSGGIVLLIYILVIISFDSHLLDQILIIITFLNIKILYLFLSFLLFFLKENIPIEKSCE